MPGGRVRLALTTGEPAGIGPDLAVLVAQETREFDWVAIGDPAVLQSRARALGLPLAVEVFDPADRRPHPAGVIRSLSVATSVPVKPGRLDAANGRYVLETLKAGCQGCLAGLFDALVTAPVHKGIINDAGFPFTGHTEYLAARCGAHRPVMMLAADGLRVALATIHLPLSAVCAAITRQSLTEVLTILDSELRSRFGISEPRITVLGLNPHAGEGGHLGREEQDTIIPVVERLRAGGMRLAGPLPADTAFTPAVRAATDAYLSMYHDQGLPVLKALAFGAAVNITLGLPIVRTSVDHGTALPLAATGRIDAGSLKAALDCAFALARNRSTPT
jgi:4-hydroxythreonine-4-phosphate dehydrogenase